jgi:hypothetical protein
MIRIPLTVSTSRLGVECAREDSARRVRPLLSFERLTEIAGYIHEGSMAWQPLAPT